MRSRRTGSFSGWLLFAAVMIFIAGFHNLIYGVADLDNYRYVVNNSGTGGGYVIYQDLDFWGWLLIALGCVQIIAAFGLMTRNRYARWFAIAVAALNIIGQLAFLAIFPVWSVVLIALDILVIWALATHDFGGERGSMAEPYPEDDLAHAERERRHGRTDYAGSMVGGAGDTGRHGSAGRGAETRGDSRGRGSETSGTGTGGEARGSEARGSEMPPPPPTTGPTG
jgi:hypothetical protein